MAKEYINGFTLDGRLKPAPYVSKRKVEAVAQLLEKHLGGDPIATGMLTEALSSSDAIFNFAHLANLNFVPDYEEAPRTWTQIAGRRTVGDLKPATLFTLFSNWEGAIGTHGEALPIPEGTAYPYAYISGQVQQAAGVRKRGLKTDWTLESRINDGMNALENLPSEMLEVSLDTEEADVYGALTTQVTANSELAGGAVPGTATAVPPNAALSRDSLTRAIIELGQREINGKKIVVNGGYNLLVAPGQALFANFILNQTLGQMNTNPAAGTAEYVYQINGYNPLAGITVIETAWVTGASWFLLPKPGATRRPVLERLELRGYQTPQLFVDNHTGNFVGGGAVDPFEGSFASDVITLKLRMFGGGVLWSDLLVVTSDGSGIA